MNESKTPGGDQELRTSTLMRPRPIQGEGHVDFLGESEGSLPQTQDLLPDAGEAINDFRSMSGSFINRHHVEPRVKLYSPREESFPIPLKYIDVSRTTHTNLDVKQGETHRRLLEHWWLSRLVWSLDSFHTIYFVRRKTSKRIFVGPGRDLRESSLHPGQIIYDQNSVRKWERMPSWRRSKSGLMKSSILENARKLRGIHFIDPEDKEFKETIKNAHKKLETSVAPALPV